MELPEQPDGDKTGYKSRNHVEPVRQISEAYDKKGQHDPEGGHGEFFLLGTHGHHRHICAASRDVALVMHLRTESRRS